MDPQQELFIALKLSIEELGLKVYDGFLPPKETPYPFVYLGEEEQADRMSKGHIYGTIDQTIHLWSNTPKKRGTVSSMLLSIKEVCRRIEQTDNFSFYVQDIVQQILPDTTTETPLLHGVLNVKFQFS